MDLVKGNTARPKVTYNVVTRGDGTMAKLTVTKGRTRGKNPKDIEYEKFDLEQPENLPKDLKEFMEVVGLDKVSGPDAQKAMLEYVISGFNDAQYSAASDEIGEFINDEWDKEYQAQFRLTVRNFSKISGKSIEDVVTMLKTAIDAGWVQRKAEKAKAAAEVKNEVKAEEKEKVTA